jgi:hypothetical protein
MARRVMTLFTQAHHQRPADQAVPRASPTIDREAGAEKKSVLDAALIAATQAVEQYEMTRYGTLIAWAKQLHPNLQVDVALIRTFWEMGLVLQEHYAPGMTGDSRGGSVRHAGVCGGKLDSSAMTDEIRLRCRTFMIHKGNSQGSKPLIYNG